MRKINTPLIDDDIQFVESDLDLAKGAIARASGMLRLAICIFSLHWLAGAMSWAATPAFSDSNWTSVGSGVNGDVLALAVSSNALYVGGSFTTAGGDANADLKYVNVRRTLIYLRESIDEGTQWVVFEPNTPALWQKITRNVTAFLTNVWRSGALFGNTAAEAFYVKCDAETNPPELRELGQVVTEIGVAIVRPAEFVVFRISQFSAPSK